MRIGLNATCLSARPSGAKQRFLGLYAELIRRRPDIVFIIYEPSDWSAAAEMGEAPNVIFQRTPLPSGDRIRRAVRGRFYWPRQLGRDRLDLFETFHLPLIRAPGCPTIVTIHDAQPVRSKPSAVKRRLQSRLLRDALRRADHVVTVSGEMRRELLSIEPRARVSTIYNGIDPEPLASCDATTSIQARFGLPKRYLLAVGHLEPRKNHVRLLDALSILRRDGRDIGLVIVGNDSGERGAISTAIRGSGIDDDVMLLEGVSDADLCAIYQASELVVFPSTYEGFGIPVLEAMAARRPLVCSDLPVFRELTQGQAAYFPPLDTIAMAAQIASVLDSPERQSAIVSYGEARVRDFSFSKLASEVERLHDSLYPSRF